MTSSSAWGLMLWTVLLAAAVPAVAEVDAPIAADTFVRGGAGRHVRGDRPELKLKGTTGSAYLRFDFSVLPAGLTAEDVESATLRLWVRRVERPGRMGLRLVMDPWSESLPDGGDLPQVLAADLGSREVTEDHERGFISLDLTDLARVWIRGSVPNHGLALVPESRRLSLVFDSKESVRGGHEPEVVLTLGRPAGSAAVEMPLTLRGPQGPEGPAGEPGAAGEAGRSLNPVKLARLQWHPGSSTGVQAPAGLHPITSVYAGGYVWTTDWESHTVTRMDPVKGISAGSFPAGNRPSFAASDTEVLWVLNNGADSVTRLSLVDGSSLGTFPVGDGPSGAAFDGTHMWIVNNQDNTIMKFSAATASLLATYPVANGPRRVAFDGESLWITCSRSHTVVKLSPVDGSVQATYGGFAQPLGIAFDGSRLWITNFDSQTLNAINAADGALLHTVHIGWDGFGVVFDGETVWAASAWTDTISRIRISDGVVLETFSAGDTPEGMAFDGARVWVANSRSDTVSVY